MIGGFTEKPILADDKVNELLILNTDAINDKLRKTAGKYEALCYKTQKVEGINYKIKCQSSDNNIYHVIIFEDLESNGSLTKLLCVMTNQTETSLL